MKWSDIFPFYPLGLGIRKGWKVRIGSRKVYVDLPYVFPLFMGEVAYRYRKMGITKSDWEKEKNQWFQKYKNLAYFNEKPIAIIQLTVSPFYKRPTLRCMVQWKVFFAYLDNLANKIAQEIKKDGERGLAALYNQIYTNYYEIFYGWGIPEFEENPRLLENFKRVVRLTGERDKIEELLRKIGTIAQNLEEFYKEDRPSISFYTLHLKMDTNGALKSLENVSILPMFFYLRNILEIFIKLFAYMDIADGFEDPDMILRVLYFYDKEIPEIEKKLKEKIKKKVNLRKGSIRNFKKEFKKKMDKILPTLPKEITLDELFDKMAERGVPILGINRSVIEEFCKSNEISLTLLEYWRACSYAIHQQTPLPFYSLLEVKGLRVFLEFLIEDLLSSIAKITKISKETLLKGSEKRYVKRALPNDISLPKKEVLREIERVVYEKEKDIKERLKEIAKNPQLCQDVFFKPKTLSSLFELLDIGSTKIREGVFQPEDIDEIATRIQAIGFKVAIYEEIKHTFEGFCLNLIPFVEKIVPKFRTLSESEKKGIVLYLLALYLPKIMKI